MFLLGHDARNLGAQSTSKSGMCEKPCSTASTNINTATTKERDGTLCLSTAALGYGGPYPSHLRVRPRPAALILHHGRVDKFLIPRPRKQSLTLLINGYQPDRELEMGRTFANSPCMSLAAGNGSTLDGCCIAENRGIVSTHYGISEPLGPEAILTAQLLSTQSPRIDRTCHDAINQYNARYLLKADYPFSIATQRTCLTGRKQTDR